MIDHLAEIVSGKKILILGFGQEGKSTFSVLKKIVPSALLFLADQNENAFSDMDQSEFNTLAGEAYLDQLADFDLIIKSPGIARSKLLSKVEPQKITSQTDLFLSAFARQTIGITGTKGKSTTSSLIHHIISTHTSNVILVGNIGVPPFDFIHKIDVDTHVIFELSSHQLDDISVSPHIAVILNIFEEHLDHYQTFEKYRNAKFKISAFQREDDYLILNRDDKILYDFYNDQIRAGMIWYSDVKRENSGAYSQDDQKVIYTYEGSHEVYDFCHRNALPGAHNLRNIMAAICAARISGIPAEVVQSAVLDFKGLEHRLEYVGNIGGIDFYNDSISTIPESTIAAIKTLINVDTLILGGKDRGIDYSGLVDFLPKTQIHQFIFMGEAGKRILSMLSGKLAKGQNTYFIEKLDEIEMIIRGHTKRGSICLLSPAASSYDMFRNFEERGRLFKKIAGNLKFPADSI
ncbi:MAG: UDP-N-acetylmuramoyl-L-alanine--D-glutamate ligase [Bacteroidetes bacterium]|nr:UDP-N-acetylmuramoyl-L-alanine--D-glutamate ligase [Bacteroidota bacterium]